MAQRLVALAGRGGDRVYRYGGEEFAILLPQTGIPGAQLLAERIVHGFASTPLELEESGERHQITVSVGLAGFDPSELQRDRSTADQSISQLATNLIARADTALYQAKHAGRSRFVTLV